MDDGMDRTGAGKKSAGRVLFGSGWGHGCTHQMEQRSARERLASPIVWCVVWCVVCVASRRVGFKRVWMLKIFMMMMYMYMYVVHTAACTSLHWYNHAFELPAAIQGRFSRVNDRSKRSLSGIEIIRFF